MKCISLWQPWASLFAAGLKKIETRSWPLRLQLPVVLAVHAAKKWDGTLSGLCLDKPFRECLAEFGVPQQPACGGLNWTTEMVEARKRGWTLPFGAVVGLVRVVECVPTERLRPTLTDRERAFGDYSPGRFGWVTDRNAVLPTPVPLTGRQSAWDWDAPADVQALAREMSE